MFSSTKIMQALSPAGAAAGYQISRSLRFNSADSAYLNRTPGSAGNRQKFTYSTWVKYSAVGTSINLFSAGTNGSTTDYFDIVLTASGYLEVDAGPDATRSQNRTNALYRDPGAFGHFVIAVDTTQSTASDRLKIYLNGVLQTYTVSGSNIPQNLNTSVNSTSSHNIGRRANGVDRYFNGYMADTILVDGQALTPSSFGETDANTGVWVPKAYTGTYGTNGFWLKFDDNSGTTATTLGKDSSGNGNNWTPNNFSVTAGVGNDSLVDTPTNYGTDTGAGGEVRGNYCTMNPLIQGSSLANGNLDQAASTVVNFGTMGVSTGKWYYEATITAQPSGGLKIGVGAAGTASEIGQGADGWAIICQSNANNGQVVNNGTLGTDYTNFAVNDVVMVAFDMDSGKLYFGKNGTWLNSAVPASGTGAVYTNLSGTLFPASTAQTGGAFSWNFGQRPFAYTAPSGFKALCTQNLPTPTVGASSTTLADDYFNIALYTGTGANLSVTGIGFQPDFVWIKGRSGATDHGLYDAVRGVQKQLESNTTTAETTETTGLTAFGTDGFTVGTLAQLNTNTATYVGWAWKANGAGSSNTAGSINSTVSANTSAGISVVTYTGNASNATVGHGLGVAPRMIIVKQRNSGVENWLVYHASLSTPATNYLLLNTTAASATLAGYWNGGPTSSVIGLGNFSGINASGGTYVAYCFAEIAGFSKFGSYTGNGSADGPFVYCGFRPRFIMIKGYAVAGAYWIIIDTARDTYNVAVNKLGPNVADAENSANLGNTTQNIVDVLSNGFKLRSTTGDTNNGSQSYVFAAFAESPFNYSRAR